MKSILLIPTILFVTLTFAKKNKSGNLKVGESAPSFTLNNHEGEPVSLANLKGKLIFIDFWASWCSPCRMANGDLTDIYTNYQPLGFEIISVSIDKKKDAWLRAIEEDQVPWTIHLWDKVEGSTDGVAELYGTEALPHTVLLDWDGTILAFDLEPYDLEKYLEDKFKNELKFFPQTASNMIRFSQETKILITNEAGEKVFKDNTNQINISDWPHGNYTVKYEGKEERLHVYKHHEKHPEYKLKESGKEIEFTSYTKYEIFNTSGILIKHGHGQHCDISDLGKGTYFVSLHGNVKPLEIR